MLFWACWYRYSSCIWCNSSFLLCFAIHLQQQQRQQNSSQRMMHTTITSHTMLSSVHVCPRTRTPPPRTPRPWTSPATARSRRRERIHCPIIFCLRSRRWSRDTGVWKLSRRTTSRSYRWSFGWWLRSTIQMYLADGIMFRETRSQLNLRQFQEEDLPDQDFALH